MRSDPLVVTVEATHQSLQQRMDEAVHWSTGQAHAHPRDRQRRTDAFTAATSRHLAAVDEALLPVVRHRVHGGGEAVSRYLHAARELEQALARLKARLYGEQHVAHLGWSEVWADVRRRLLAHDELERDLVDVLASHLHEGEAQALAERVYRAELRAPTRAHPYLPHRGRLGRAARRVWSVADRFWDAAESRSVPPPVRPKPKEHTDDSLVAQYLMGEPLLDAHAPLLAHRRHRRGEPVDR